MIRTLVVDDDFRVAEVNSAYVEKVQGFTVCGQAHSAGGADTAITSMRPDLVLLDLYLPDEHGLQLLRRVRANTAPPDFIVITAARDADNIRAAMQLGAVHLPGQTVHVRATRGTAVRLPCPPLLGSQVERGIAGRR